MSCGLFHCFQQVCADLPLVIQPSTGDIPAFGVQIHNPALFVSFGLAELRMLCEGFPGSFLAPIDSPTVQYQQSVQTALGHINDLLRTVLLHGFGLRRT